MRTVFKYFALLIFCSIAFAEASLSDFDGKNIGVLQGTIHDKIAQERWPASKIFYYKDTTDMILALKRGTIDGYVSVEPSIRCLMNERDDIEMFPEMLSTAEYAYVFAKNEHGASLQKQMNEFLSKLRADGTLIKTRDLWTGKDESKKNVEIPTSGKNGSLKFATALNDIPFAYIKDGKPAGYDVDIAARFCSEYGYALEIFDMDFAALLAGVTAGKYDFGADGIAVTAERKEAMLFSDANYDGGNVLVVKKNKRATASNSKKQGIDFNSKKTVVAVEPTTILEAALDETYPNVKKMFITNATDGFLAVKIGKADAYAGDKTVFGTYERKDAKGLSICEEIGQPGNVAVGISRITKIEGLKEKVNKALSELKTDGTIDEMWKRWVFDTNYKMPEIAEPKNPAITIKVGTTGLLEPYTFYSGNELTGFDIELMYRIALKLNAKIEFSTYTWEAIIPAAVTGKVDLILSNLMETPERAEQIDFSVPYYQVQTVLVVREEALSKDSSFFSSIATSFEKTFIREDRYKLILQGIGTTMFISVFAAIFGTLLGFGVCMLRRSKNKVASGAAVVYIRILQGTPIVVFLMILYYVVFGKSSVKAEWVAIIGFAMNFAAYVSEMMRTGIDAVDNGQIEAALAIGFNKFQTFTKIVMPQAARHFLPVYKGELISLVKSTSIVGYIAIQDLTKMSDIIRSRTYEAFFPLIATAIIYFVLAYLLTIVLNCIMKKIEPKHGVKKAMGVKI